MIATITKRFVDVGGELGVLEEGTEVEVVRAQPNMQFLEVDGCRSDMVSDRLVAAWCVLRRAADLGYGPEVAS